MTVDTNSQSQQHASATASGTVSVTRRNRQEVIKTIQEITRFDELTINRAIEACQDSDGRYSMDQVLNVLMDEKYSNEPDNFTSNKNYNNGASNRYNNNMDEYSRQNSKYYSSSGNAKANIDSDYSSLNDDEEINNEFDLIRENYEEKPCGLKNVGNTCWFNSIIQAFFHLPYFRKLVLSYQITASGLEKLDDNSKNVVLFIFELRKLFALLLKTKRKAINPNNSLRVLRNCSKYNVNHFNQEDVSEFSTILVNLIEESFDILDRIEQNHQQQQQQQLQMQQVLTTSPTTSSSTANTTTINTSTSITTNVNTVEPTTSTTTDSSMTSNTYQTSEDVQNKDQQQQQQQQQRSSSNKNRKNPIVNLLNGDIMIMRKSNDDKSSRTEIFREVNIQMLNARTLYDGLELEWGETSFDTTATNKQMTESVYEQESWLMQLPSVLFICLNRYKFVKATQSSSKIIEPFEFYEHIYLDRYMYSNKDKIKLKRIELKKLRNELNLLEEKLNTIKSYKFNDKTYPLDDILKCTLNFASTNHENEIFSELNPKPTSEQSVSSTFLAVTSSTMDTSTSHLNSLKLCLENWIISINGKINELEFNIKEIKQKIDRIYDEDDLKNVKYNLHSVCVHEGSAALGHFWTYIWNQINEKWYKYNDIEVSESNWNDLYTNAVGGANAKPSAYFLIYVKSNDSTLYQDSIELTSDLEKLIREDEELLQQQLNTIKLKQIYKNLQDTIKTLSPTINVSNDTYQTCVEHAKTFSEYTNDAFEKSFDRILTEGPEAALKHAIERQIVMFSESPKDVQNKLPEIDMRTIHILTYFSCNNIVKELREFALIDLFRIHVFSDNDIRLKILQTQAQIKYYQVLQDQSKLEFFKQYEKCQLEYRDFRSVIAAFITACQNMEYEKYEEATQFFCVSCEFNERITNNLKQKLKGMDHDLLLKCRRYCLKQWNQSVIKKITQRNQTQLASTTTSASTTNTSDNIESTKASLPTSPTTPTTPPLTNQLNNLDGSFDQQDRIHLIETMINKFIPCFARLLINTTSEDRAMIEEIRQDWLSILDNNLAEMQVFQDFMSKLFEDHYGNHYHQLSVNKQNLYDRYKDTVHSLKTILITIK